MKRKVFRLVLALVLCMCLAVPVLAADEHPYATALRDFFSNAKAGEFTKAYLGDIDGDGVEEVLAGCGFDSYSMEYRLFSMNNGSLVTTVLSGSDGGYYYISSNNYLVTVGGEAFGNWWTVWAFEAGQVVHKEGVSSETGTFDERGEVVYDEPEYYYSGYTNGTHIYREISKAEFDAFLIKHGFDGHEPSDATAKILAMTTGTAASPSVQTVNPTASTVYINGEATAFDAYLISDNNFFKLRDLAYVLNGTEKQFSVGFDGATSAITLTSGQPYEAVGGEMTQGDGQSKDAIPTPSTIYLDCNVLDFVVYNIGGNNFFKLRDLMRVIDVYVGYDSATRNITIDTSRSYTEE